MSNYFIPGDTGKSIVRQTALGTIDASPVWLELEYTAGDDVQKTNDWLESPARRQNRGNAGGKKTKKHATGTLSAHLHRDAAIDLLLESALSGTWSSDVLQSGATDTYFAFEKRMENGSGTTYYNRFKDCQVSKLTIKGSAEGNITASFDIITADRGEQVTTEFTGSTRANAAQTLKLDGVDVGQITIGGLSLDMVEFELTVEFQRSAKSIFGSGDSSHVSTGDKISASGSLKFFREDWAPDVVFDADDSAAILIPIGSGADGYSLELPAAQFKFANDAEEDNSLMTSVEFMGQTDATDGTVKVTRLS